jgi:predicted RNA-binding protein (virulence factor B family)
MFTHTAVLLTHRTDLDEAVVATSSAPDWQNSWQEVGAEVQRQLREKRERGDIPEPTRVERVLQQLEARYQQQLNQDQPPSAPSSSSTSTSTQEQKESETIK